ncbi:DUF3298 and DUF4163 domain-containing protein [Caldalkalibacillus mannanilyticus]|uniref:DUF3298 and DUF4163 domain-containing protein n=1 Tax=Caldalkalibacillus mannanilyticus TaxID=1418 RepID=UPI00046A458F|nr:DUF3298 and DUF4163 domain-containing protein [Caldalkalibacillus mannanilyticus]
MKKIEEAKKNYENIEIPEELDFIVHQAIRESERKMKSQNKVKTWVMGTAAAAVLFVGSINVSPAMASALAEVPVVGQFVKVVTFREYKVDEGNYQANIQIPALEGLENEDLQKGLNEKYLNENKQLYEEFMKEIEELKTEGIEAHLGVDSGYEIKADNDKILSIGRYVVNTVGSSSTTFKYDTIDKQNQVLITLPSLFLDERYIEVISQNIQEQMKQQMKEDPEKIYWVTTEDFDPFEKIAANQNFYINNEFQLVISFDKYEVAPGYMGVVEFIIPTDILSPTLVSTEYVK